MSLYVLRSREPIATSDLGKLVLAYCVVVRTGHVFGHRTEPDRVRSGLMTRFKKRLHRNIGIGHLCAAFDTYVGKSSAILRRERAQVGHFAFKHAGLICVAVVGTLCCGRKIVEICSHSGLTKRVADGRGVMSGGSADARIPAGDNDLVHYLIVDQRSGIGEQRELLAINRPLGFVNPDHSVSQDTHYRSAG